ncbi:MAG: enoyl-CoA hydratase/isomerase family protein [Actinomycetota bacterium]
MTDRHDFAVTTITVADGVAVAEVDNPPVNLMTRELFGDLRALPDHLADHTDARVLILRSANPDYFIAHYDVELILAAPTDGSAERPTRLHGFHRMCERYRTMDIPVLCEIDGRVGGGGGELAASCDMRFGTVGRTILCQMEVPLGILPGGSGTQRLPRLLGRGPAMEIVLGGDDIDAATLERWGWLNRALPPGELRPHVEGLASRIASFPTEAVRQAKAAVLAAGPDPTEGLLTEAHRFQQTLRDPAASRRMEAFLAQGGQTPAGEFRVGALGAELGDERGSTEGRP